MHQYIVSNTIPYNMKWDSKKGAARGNILGKNFSVCTQYLHLKMVSNTETHNTVLSYSQQHATGHPILIQMSEVHILAPYFLGTDMQEKTLLLGSSSKCATSNIFEYFLTQLVHTPVSCLYRIRDMGRKNCSEQ